VIGVDTNVLVRWLTNDDQTQAEVAKRLLEARSAEDPAYVSVIVLVETLWVLRSVFDYPRSQIPPLVEQMLAVSSLRFEQARLVERAARLAQEGDFDFPDTLIAVLNGAAGCADTRTFDRKAARIPGMAPVKS
jgi:predicted nucleic-acid-binding protein